MSFEDDFDDDDRRRRGGGKSSWWPGDASESERFPHRRALGPCKRTLTEQLGKPAPPGRRARIPGKITRTSRLPMQSGQRSVVQRSPGHGTSAALAGQSAGSAGVPTGRAFLQAIAQRSIEIDDSQLIATTTPHLQFAIAAVLAETLPTATVAWRVEARDAGKDVASGNAAWKPGTHRSPQIRCTLPHAGKYTLRVVVSVPGQGSASVSKVIRARDPGVATARGASDEELLGDQKILRGRIATVTDPRQRKNLVDSYNAANWVAHSRGLQSHEDWSHKMSAQQGDDPVPTEPGAIRDYIERTMVAEGSSKGQVKVLIEVLKPGVSAEQRALAHIALREVLVEQHELDKRFKREAMNTAWLMVNGSSRQIGDILRGYGLTVKVSDLIDELANEDGNADVIAERLIARSKAGDNKKGYAAKSGARAQLMRVTRELSVMQGTLHGLYGQRAELLTRRENAKNAGAPRGHIRSAADAAPRRFDVVVRDTPALKARGWSPLIAPPRPTPPAHGDASNHELAAVNTSLSKLEASIKQAQLAFKTRWIESERDQPVLAAYREEPGKFANLAPFGGDNDEQVMRRVVAQLMPKLANLSRLTAYLKQGTVDPLALSPVVSLTKQRLLIRPGTMRDMIATELVAGANDDGLGEWAIAAVTLGLALLTAIPTAGSSLVVLGELTGLALDVYLAAESYADYSVQSGLTDTAIDPSRALSSQEPSLTWLAVQLVGTGLGAAFAVKTFREALAVRRALEGSEEAAAAIRHLDALGDEHGLGPIGTRVAHERPGKRLANSSSWDGGVVPKVKNTGAPYADPRIDPDLPHAFLDRRELLPARRVKFHSDWKRVSRALKKSGDNGVAIGRPIRKIEDGRAVIAGLARGDSGVLETLGISGIPEGFDSTGREWALVQGRDGYFVYAGHYNGIGLPSDVRILAHTHPGPVRTGEFVNGSPQRHVADLPVAKDGGIKYEEILGNPSLAKDSGIVPSAADIHAISDGTPHVIYTRYLHAGHQLIGNPGTRGSQIAIHLSGTKVLRINRRTGEVVYVVDVAVRDAAGHEIWSGYMFSHKRRAGYGSEILFEKPPWLNRPAAGDWEEP